jgi:hypothetical protein
LREGEEGCKKKEHDGGGGWPDSHGNRTAMETGEEKEVRRKLHKTEINIHQKEEEKEGNKLAEARLALGRKLAGKWPEKTD